MDLRERVLYHQVHPLKLATDWLTAAVAATLLWRHLLASALVVGFVPSIVVSAVLLRFADLTRCRDSWLGRYVSGFMTRRVELGRFLGLALSWAGAWRHSVPLLAGGVIGIIACWSWGYIVREAAAGRSTRRAQGERGPVLEPSSGEEYDREDR